MGFTKASRASFSFSVSCVRGLADMSQGKKDPAVTTVQDQGFHQGLGYITEASRGGKEQQK